MAGAAATSEDNNNKFGTFNEGEVASMKDSQKRPRLTSDGGLTTGTFTS